MLMGLLECGDEEWGAHPGQLCEGPELSLDPISQGVSLAGWWTLEETSLDAELFSNRSFLLIDAGQFLRAWSRSGGQAYQKYKRETEEWAFGCESYLDFPLVAGQENRSPAESKLPTPGCEGTGGLRDASSRRFLSRVAQQEGMLCFYYEHLDFKTFSKRTMIEDRSELQMLCLGYDRVQDQLKLRYAIGDKPALDARFVRYFGSGDESSYGEAKGSGDGSQAGHLSTASGPEVASGPLGQPPLEEGKLR